MERRVARHRGDKRWIKEAGFLEAVNSDVQLCVMIRTADDARRMI